MNLLLIGCGKMGGALLGGWQQHRAALNLSRIDVIEPHAAEPHPGVTYHTSLDHLPADYAPAIIVLAIKPQQLAELLPAYKKRFEAHHPLYISIAAGKDLAFYAAHMGGHAHVVRAMPNTPALVAHGMSVLCAAQTLSQSARAIATRLMEAVGKVEWLADESLMDAVTAISGSGPAYVFLFLDALTKAGVASGLPEALSRTLAVETLLGSAALARQSQESFAQLRQNVTSPGGTTEAALAVLMKDDAFAVLIGEAAAAAKARAQAL